MNKIINVAVIGAGTRGRCLIRHLLYESNRNLRILSVYDPDKAVAQESLDTWKSPSTKICGKYLEAIGEKNSGVW